MALNIIERETESKSSKPKKENGQPWTMSLEASYSQVKK
jgi:hypothetical protein